MAAKKGFDSFESIFGEINSEAENQNQEKFRPFLFYVHALDPSRLEIVASDFHSNTFAKILTVNELDDLRDDIGIGGSWSEFVDYLAASLSSGIVKLTMNGESNAKLIAHKAKGLPRISLPLNRLTNSLANNAMANLSLAMFKAFKDKRDNSIKEHEHLLQVKGLLSFEREKCERLQKELDTLPFLNKRKVHKSKISDKALLASDVAVDNNTVMVPETQPSTSVSQAQLPLANQTANVEAPIVKSTQPIKNSQRAAPVSRRAKTRGVSLRDAGDDDS